MDDYVQTTSDNGGVHINSEIQTIAYYHLAMELGGHAWEKAGVIWYSALRDPRLQPTARFSTFARTTARAARRIYGDDSEEAAAVARAWDQVGVALSQQALAASHR